MVRKQPANAAERRQPEAVEAVGLQRIHGAAETQIALQRRAQVRRRRDAALLAVEHDGVQAAQIDPLQPAWSRVDQDERGGANQPVAVAEAVRIAAIQGAFQRFRLQRKFAGQLDPLTVRSVAGRGRQLARTPVAQPT